MKVALGFRLYMMRYGPALLAASFAGSTQPSSTNSITERIKAILTQRVAIPVEMREAFERYLAAKPGSPRYTPLRKKLAGSLRVEVEQQDLWLSEPNRLSSVGAFTENYFEDALGLAHILGLIEKNRNLLLARGRIAIEQRETTNPFALTERDAALLGIWLIDIDGDWLWAFLQTFTASREIVTVQNRVSILLETWTALLDARQLRSGADGELVVRRRLQELKKITERNVREGLNLGQPWSWFFVPRLELLVDAGILLKAAPGGLDRYRLSPIGERLKRRCEPSGGARNLLEGYFACRLGRTPMERADIPWVSFVERLQSSEKVLRTSVGYYPLFETAVLVCLLENSAEMTQKGTWEIPAVEELVKEAAKGPSRKALVGVSREGQITNFKLVG